MRLWFHNFLDGDEWRNNVLDAFPAEQREDALRFMRGWMEEMFEEMLSSGPREVFAARVEADLPGALRSNTDELITRYLFRQSVESVVQTVLKITDAAAVAKLVDLVRLEDCPGIWLRYAVDRELRSARAKWEAGATYDLLHLSHLPYVDLMFTDAEIADNVRKVRQRDGVPPVVAQARSPVSVGGSLDQVEHAILTALPDAMCG